VKHDAERSRRLACDATRQRDHRAGVNAAGEKDTEWDVTDEMQAHRFF